METIQSYRNNISDYTILEYSRLHEEERLASEFTDMLAMPEVSTNRIGIAKGSVVSSNKVVDTKSTVEIILNHSHGDDDEPMTVLLHRDLNNHITRMEVVCACKRKTEISLEYDNDQGQETIADDQQ